jgi:hypothetical protein
MPTRLTFNDTTMAIRGLLVTAGLLCVVSDAVAQSLGRIAALEAARRSAITTPARVLTNGDLGRTAVATATVMPTPREVAPTIAAAPRVGDVSPVEAARRVPVAEPLIAAANRNVIAPAAVVEAIPVRPQSRPDTSSIVSSPDRRIPVPRPVRRSALAAGGGWQAITVPKSEAERAAESLLDPATPRARAIADVLPPARDRLQTGVAVGYVPGADWASELTARGTFYGIRTQFQAITTMGPEGLEYQSGHLALIDADFGWSASAGDLFSDIRGLRRGVRLAWNNAARHQPAVALYLPASAIGSQKTVLAYRDELRAWRGATIGGEVLSDGSLFVRARQAARRWNTEASYRQAAAPYAGTDLSWFGAYDLWRGFVVRASTRSSHSPADQGSGHAVALRIPLPAGFSLTYESARSVQNATDHAAHIFTADLPIGPVRVLQRMQIGDTVMMLAGRPAHVEQRRLQTMASYAPVRWASVGLQQANEWQMDGSIRTWQELQTTVHVGRRAAVVASTAVPDALNRERLNVRLSYDLAPSWGLSVDYGNVAPFQSGPRVNSGTRDLRVMLRKTWDTPVPARGGRVQGRVIDQIGNALPGALVRLGRYQTVTDDAGAFQFLKVPSGVFEFSLDRETLPADYVGTGGTRRFTVTSRTRRVEEWLVVPLHAIHGHVYVDRNENGAYDSGEEVAGIVLRLGDRASATTPDGAYGFYNLEPGHHVVRLDVDRLPADLVPLSDVQLPVDLQPSGSQGGADFRLGLRKKQILIQELRRP